MLKSLRTLTLVLLAFIAGGLITLDAAGVTRISFGTALPTNCVAGNVFVKTSATTGVYWCSTPGSPGTWTAVGGGGTGDVVGPASATADRIAVFDGTTGKLIKDGGTTIAGLTAGAGATISTSAFASPPSSPSSGDLWLPTDSFYANRYSGSAWVPWGPIFPLTDPALAAPTTWVNQGTATVSSSLGPIVLTNDGGVSIALRAKTAPATPYTITIICNATTTAAFGQVQFGFRESSSGKLTGIGVMPSGNLEIQKWNSPTSFNANYTTFGAAYPSSYAKGLMFLQIADDGTTRYYRVSGDNGLTWRTAHSVGRTDFLTADQVYFGADNESGGSPYTVMVLHSWKET